MTSWYAFPCDGAAAPNTRGTRIAPHARSASPCSSKAPSRCTKVPPLGVLAGHVLRSARGQRPDAGASRLRRQGAPAPAQRFEARNLAREPMRQLDDRNARCAPNVSPASRAAQGHGVPPSPQHQNIVERRSAGCTQDHGAISRRARLQCVVSRAATRRSCWGLIPARCLRGAATRGPASRSCSFPIPPGATRHAACLHPAGGQASVEQDAAGTRREHASAMLRGLSRWPARLHGSQAYKALANRSDQPP
jgi:hypothetical protein